MYTTQHNAKRKMHSPIECQLNLQIYPLNFTSLLSSSPPTTTTTTTKRYPSTPWVTWISMRRILCWVVNVPADDVLLLHESTKNTAVELLMIFLSRYDVHGNEHNIIIMRWLSWPWLCVCTSWAKRAHVRSVHNRVQSVTFANVMMTNWSNNRIILLCCE